ncbi:MAG: UTP--glucose-1-phosphate uridylyltransferase [Rickettsiales bacterium]|nr:UTP--glucose-1-phosphate uridylyltransferase [Rickettsiales bacterium]
MKKKITKAIFPVAGYGTRFLPATKSIPKEMLTVLDRPIIEWSVTEAFKSGIEQIIFVLSSKKSSILEHFDRSMLLEDILKKKNKKKELFSIKSQTEFGDITTVMQTEPKGLGHAIWCARKLIKDEKFAVILPDDIIQSKIPVLKQMISLEKKIGGSILALEEVPKKETHKYGIVEIKKSINNYFLIKDLVEKPEPGKAPSNLSIIGRYILEDKVFNFLDKQKIGKGGEIQLTDAIKSISKKSKIFGYKFNGIRYDCGFKLGFIKANLGFALEDDEINEELKKHLRVL